MYVIDLYKKNMCPVCSIICYITDTHLHNGQEMAKRVKFMAKWTDQIISRKRYFLPKLLKFQAKTPLSTLSEKVY